MDLGMLDAALHAMSMLSEPSRLMFLALGALLGLILGILPGIGGVAGTAILIPFTFSMDPYMAFAFLLGLASTTATGDPIPAVLFGMPGGAGSAATVLDGHPMAKRGEAGRALSACYMSSLLGGVFGALLMAVSIPILQPMVLAIGSPELLALAVFGISMVAVLSGNTTLRGLAACGLGLMLAMVGTDLQTGTQRWTLDSIYLWEGLHLIPIVLGLFALPELCDLAVARSAVAREKLNISGGMWQGANDCFRHWWLVLRCSWIGAFFGAIPGIVAAIIDWFAYGHALRTEKGAPHRFGSGDVRGVIASESANNAKEGGALIPTVAFGVPGSAGMAVLLGAFGPVADPAARAGIARHGSARGAASLLAGSEGAGRYPPDVLQFRRSPVPTVAAIPGDTHRSARLYAVRISRLECLRPHCSPDRRRVRPCLRFPQLVQRGVPPRDSRRAGTRRSRANPRDTYGSCHG
jgi:TctA family transporter